MAGTNALLPGVSDGKHVIGEFVGRPQGPTLIVFGSLHGNEAAGALALSRAASRMAGLSARLGGRAYFLAGNTRAIGKAVRFIDSDLNRHWTAANIERNSSGHAADVRFSEDAEQSELLALLRPILETACDEVFALDLHSTSAEGVPFATVGDTIRNRTFARKFPINILLGIEEQLEGTLLEYLNNLGAVTLGYEAGQHFAESTVDTHEALVWAAMVNAGLLEERELPAGVEPFAVLKKVTGRARIFEVRYRHAITEADRFEMLPGFNNFDPVRKGQLLAGDAGGEIAAGESGLILMPLYQKLGEDGFFIGREVARFWIWLSGVLRMINAASLMPVLPGVRSVKGRGDVLEIDTRIARFFPLQVFHLLGFRKLRRSANKLLVSRRLFDTVSPFKGRDECS